MRLTVCVCVCVCVACKNIDKTRQVTRETERKVGSESERNVCVYVCMYIEIEYVCFCPRIYEDMHSEHSDLLRACVSAYKYIHTYIHTYTAIMALFSSPQNEPIHTYIHTYIHTQQPRHTSEAHRIDQFIQECRGVQRLPVS